MHSALPRLLGLVLLSTTALAGAVAAQDPAPVEPGGVKQRAGQHRPEPKDLSPEFLALSNAWKGALRDYGIARLNYDRANAALAPDKRDAKGPPPHPAAVWWGRFEELGQKGDPDALGWLVEQSMNAFDVPEARAAAAEKAFDALLSAQPGHRCVEDALEALRPLYESFGRERFTALIIAAHAKAQGSENQARALVLQAWAISDRYKDLSPERQRELQGLYDEILVGHPGTRAARKIAGDVYTQLEREFLVAELAWIEAVRALQKQGKEPKDWPRQPMHLWYEKYLPVAAAGGPQATKFVNKTYPAYQQAEGNSIGFGLVWLQGFWASSAPLSADDWVRARIGLVEIAARQFHGQPLVTSAMVDVARDAGMFPLDALEPALAPVLADDSVPKAQALALCARALALVSHNSWSDWQAARKDAELVLSKYPTEDIAARAQALLASMQRVWPGQPAPDFRGTDQDGLAFKLTDYEGFVTVIDFGSASGGLAAEDIAQRKQLIRSFEGRPFRWLGGVCEPRTQKGFHESFGAAGVDWRCAILGTRQSEAAGLWSVQAFPAVFVVDAEGKIRARNLPWDEQKALIETLVAEAERKRKH